MIPVTFEIDQGRQLSRMLLEYLDLATGRAMLDRWWDHRSTDRRRFGQIGNDASSVTLTANPDARHGFLLWMEFNWPEEYGDRLVTVELTPEQVKDAVALLYEGEQAILEAQARAAAEAPEFKPEEEPEPAGTVWVVPPPPTPLFTPRTIWVIPPHWHGRPIFRLAGGGLFALDEQNRLIPISQEQWEEYLRKQQGLES